MELTGGKLVETLAACSKGPSDEPAEIVALVRREQPSFAATLYSAWQAEGAELSPALLGELEAGRARVDFYRSVAARVMSAFGGLSTIKGLEVAALYPPGLVRYMNDLDFVAPAERDLWPAVSFLLEDGWDLDTATFFHAGGALQVMVSLRRPNEDRYQLPYGIEVATYYALGDQGGIPPILQLPGQWSAAAIKNTLMLLHERYEQPFRARDVVDAALLHESLRDGEADALHRGVVALGLAAEYSELVRLVRDAGLGSPPPLPGGQWTTARGRARRFARGASFFAQPLSGAGRHLQRRLMQGEPGRVEGMAWAAVQRRLPVVAAVRAGILAFGLPLDGPRPDVTATVLCRRGEVAWADTPVGRFLLTIGDEVTQSAVDELSGPRDDAGEAARETAEQSL
jgi:hypothetical protein